MQEAEEKKHRKEEEKAAKEAAIQLQNEINLANQDKKNIKKPSTAEEIEDINKKSKEEVEEAHVMFRVVSRVRELCTHNLVNMKRLKKTITAR
ncbi:uncharacterized protein ATNIH1004_005421 [Aspergillus tanneri]|uniref:Uncharacterized protein n=1 Tax=Aspergillus tanneri TaxID=1220188 RepID=A0A5M9MLG4_9EURO|nr:uncharacterized protein ATNIH1004_005421 [Aspergillus tanneri]KAA8646746.1 hypothetical protein ATNIH1004_005421 [Aspergillus tanneri]